METTHGAAPSPPGLHSPRWHGVMPSILFAETRGKVGTKRAMVVIWSMCWPWEGDRQAAKPLDMSW